MRPYRDVGVLAGAQILCFMLLALFEPRLVILHLYQSIFYLALLLLLYYRALRWACMLAMLASAVWLVLAYESSLLNMAVQQVLALHRTGNFPTPVSILALVTGMIAVAMIVSCARHWAREYAGRDNTWVTFAISFGIVAVYYGIFLRWFWAMIPA